jgi:hypothetical protein
MSLDLDKVTVVKPSECIGDFIALTDCYGGIFESLRTPHLQKWLDDKLLKKLKFKYKQKTGILPILRPRIGRNCMNQQWLYDDMIATPNYRPDCQDDDHDLDILFWERRLILPDEIQIKLTPYLADDADIDMDDLLIPDFDFLFINW